MSPKDVSNYFTEKKINIKPSNVNFHDAIKKIGIYEINIRLHPEVGCNLKINIATSEENAKNQKDEFEKPKKESLKTQNQKKHGEKKRIQLILQKTKKKIKHLLLKIKLIAML